jgi:hypothetical protein
MPKKLKSGAKTEGMPHEIAALDDAVPEYATSNLHGKPAWQTCMNFVGMVWTDSRQV